MRLKSGVIADWLSYEHPIESLSDVLFFLCTNYLTRPLKLGCLLPDRERLPRKTKWKLMHHTLAMLTLYQYLLIMVMVYEFYTAPYPWVISAPAFWRSGSPSQIHAGSKQDFASGKNTIAACSMLEHYSC